MQVLQHPHSRFMHGTINKLVHVHPGNLLRTF